MKPQGKEKFPLNLDFFSLFVHELKSPLISLKFQLDQLKSESMEVRKQVKDIQLDIHRLFQFIEDGMNTKKLEDPFELKKEWVSWAELVQSSIQHLKDWVKHKELNIHYKEDVSLEAYVDCRWMTVVINNLLLNAIQHSPRQSSLWIQTSLKEDNSLCFTVKDEGLGVREEMKDKLFHRFQTGRPVTASYIKGTGLGLYIVKSLVEKHDGKVGVESSGCTFYLHLPESKKSSIQQVS